MLKIIAAIGNHNELGHNNELLWNLRDDLRHFSRSTMCSKVVCGSKTFASIGGPLEGREMLVLSRETFYSPYAKQTTIKDVLEMSADEDIWVIGGGQIYNIFLPYCDFMMLTHVDYSFPYADTRFPRFDVSEWNIETISEHNADEHNSEKFIIKKHTRKP